MNESSSIDRRPFDLGAGAAAVLLIHGYTASPAEVRPMGEALSTAGMRVVAPLLPGHGTSAGDLNRFHWRDMAECVASELYGLLGHHDRVFVAGISMGGLLALHLAARCQDIAGVIPMAAASRVTGHLHHLLPLLSLLPLQVPKSRDIHSCVEDKASGHLVWSYDATPVRFAMQLMHLAEHVRDHLRDIHAPLLAIHGARDRAVPVQASQEILREVSSRDTEFLLLPHTGHCLTVDGERALLFGEVVDWLLRHGA